MASTLSTILTIMSAIIPTGLIFSGLKMHINPHAMSQTFGLLKPTPEKLTFVPCLGGRNIAQGLAIWSLKYLGQRQAVGAVLMCLAGNGVSDVIVLKRLGEEEGGSVRTHVVVTGVVVGVGALLLAGY